MHEAKGYYPRHWLTRLVLSGSGVGDRDAVRYTSKCIVRQPFSPQPVSGKPPSDIGWFLG